MDSHMELALIEKPQKRYCLIDSSTVNQLGGKSCQDWLR
jgi:hypothetical protein